MNNNDLDMLMDITGVGDSMVLLTFVLALSVYLLILGYRREPLAVGLSFFVPATIIGTLKIAFYICNTNLWGIVSPSGHAAISISVLGISALLFAKLCSGIWRAILPIVLVSLAVIIAVSRTVLGMHTDGDVVIGSLIGVSVVILIAKFVLSYRIQVGDSTSSSPQKRAHPAIIVCLMIAVLGVSYGIKLPSEKLMSAFAKEIKKNLQICD